jgi:hypothetical protein
MNNNSVVINSTLLNKNKNKNKNSLSSHNKNKTASDYYYSTTNHAATTFPSIITANHYLCLMNTNMNMNMNTNTNTNTNTSRCEGSSPSSSSSSPQQQQIDRQRYNEQHEILLAQQEEPPCSVCKYTGMTVCAGLSLYFIKLANEETSTATKTTPANRTITTTPTSATTTTNYFTALANNVVAANNKTQTPMKNHRPFFYICSVGWAIAGVYRWYLD